MLIPCEEITTDALLPSYSSFMQTRTYQFVTSTGQANAVNRRIIAPGYIHMVCWNLRINSVSDDVACAGELSFQSTSQLATDDGQGIIDACEIYQNILTSGFSIGSSNKVCSGLYIPVGVGQIVYLNTSIGTGGQVKCLMHVIER